jgi:hypothetical protein
MGPPHALSWHFLAHHLVHHPHKADGVQKAQQQKAALRLSVSLHVATQLWGHYREV